MKEIYQKNRHFIWHKTQEARAYGSVVGLMHYDQTPVVTYFKRGTGQIQIEENSFFIEEGSVLILNPHEFHRCYFNENSRHERISLYLNVSLAEGLSCSASELFSAFYDRPNGKNNIIPAAVVSSLQIDRLLESIKCPEEGDTDGDILMQCKIIKLVILLKSAVKAAGMQEATITGNPKITEVIRYINDHIAENFSTSELATRLFLDKSYLCRIFKKYTGTTINEYVSRKRIDLAIRLMNSGVPCTETCYKCGFGNYSSFFKCFKRYTGTAPNSREPISLEITE